MARLRWAPRSTQERLAWLFFQQHPNSWRQGCDGGDRATILCAEAEGGLALVAWFLAFAGADLNARDGESETALSIAARRGDRTLLTLLLSLFGTRGGGGGLPGWIPSPDGAAPGPHAATLLLARAQPPTQWRHSELGQCG